MKRYFSIALTCLLLAFTILSSTLVYADTTQAAEDTAIASADTAEAVTGTVQAAATGSLKVHMLKIDSGREDCFIIQLPNGETMIIDISTGGCTPVINKLDTLGITSVKYLVGTHNHSDHIGAINNFLNTGFKIDNTQIYFPKGDIQEAEDCPELGYMKNAAANRGLTIKRLVRHDVILNTTYDGKLLEIRVVSPHANKVDGKGNDDFGAVNAASLALKVTYGDKSMLFMADCPFQPENDILADPENSDLWGQVIKVGHHGVLSGTAPTTTDPFLDKVKPQYAFITNDDLKINGELRQRLQSRNIEYWIVGVSGTVWIATDGTNPWTYSKAPTWSPPPVITISDYIKTPTNKDITVTATTNKGTLNVASHTFTENGSFEFVATDKLTATESRKTVTITNIDKVPPEITIGDYIKTFTNKDITVTAATNEGTINSTSYTFTENGSYEFVATDAAGNVTRKTVTITNIDKVAPTVVISSPVNDTKYILNQKLLADWSVSDNLSGIAAATGSINNGGVIDTSAVGPKSFTVTATDNAGNISTKTVNYSVTYAFGGMLQPVSIDKTNNAGSAIPVKFQLKDANNNYVTNAEAKVYYSKLSNGIPGAEAEALSTGAQKEGNTARYDSTENQYIFNLSTKGWDPGSYQITVKLNDGTAYSVQIELK